MKDLRTWLDAQWPRMVGAGRWLLANGPHWINPESWDTRPYRVLIARLSPWQDVRYSSTHRLLYSIIASDKQVFPDLAFLPPLRDTKLFRSDNMPWWFGLGSRKAATEFDCLAISNALVQELINLAPALVASGIPLAKSERMVRKDIPLVIVGGANSLHASALWSKDPCVDGIFLGEDPEAIQSLFNQLTKCKSRGLSKQKTLAILRERIPGFFEPDVWAATAPRVHKTHGAPSSTNAFKMQEPALPDGDIAGNIALHISEGCPSFCSFCAESYARKPYREASHTQLMRSAKELKREQGIDSIDLFSFNFNNHSQIHSITTDLLRDFGAVGLKSQRFDALSDDPTLVELMRLAGKSNITCGLEGISERMRAYLQKGLSEQKLKRALEELLRQPLRELKIFLITTGHETEEDFVEFRALLKWFDALYGRTPKRPRVMFSATPLVRFPWTPLEFEDAPRAEDSGRAVRAIKDCVMRLGFEFREAATEWESEVSQILVRAKDPRILTALQVAQERTGFLYAELIDEAFALAFREALGEQGIAWESCLLGHDFKDIVPWQMLDPGISRPFIFKMFQDSLQYTQRSICLGTFDALGKCSACDACEPAERKAIIAQRNRPQLDAHALEKELHNMRQQEVEIHVPVTLSAQCARWPWRVWGSWIARALIQSLPSFAHGFRHIGHADWEDKIDDEFCLVTGDIDFSFRVTPEAKLAWEALLESPKECEQLQTLLNPWCKLQPTPKPTNAGRLELHGVPHFSPDTWLRSKGLKFTLVRRGDRKYYDLSKDSLKKKILQEASIQETSSGQILHLVPGEKFVLTDFLRNCSLSDLPEEWRRIQSQFFWNGSAN